MFSKPDWLREPRGYDVLPQTCWIPVVTFLQVSADMAVAVDVPDGHGHRYVADVANGWAAVLSAARLDAGQDGRLRYWPRLADPATCCTPTASPASAPGDPA